MTMDSDSVINLTDMERDIIGEVMNISMGAAATAMSTILDKKVSITAPRLEMHRVEDFGFTHLEPALGVVIKYVEGIDGLNMLLLKVADFKKILSHLLGMPPEDMADEFDEISISAIGEIMNQMMGAGSGALSTFLGIKINISPPEVLDTTNRQEVQEKYSLKGDYIIGVKFDINIEGLVKSEFVSIMDPNLAKEIIQMTLGENQVEEEAPSLVEREMPTEPATQVQETEIVPIISHKDPVQQTPRQAYQQAPLSQSQPAYQPQPALQAQQIQATPFTYQQLDQSVANSADVKEDNMDLIMSVPVQITVELGKARRKIKDIAEFAPGNIVELDRQAGDQVDIVANGKLIARGDVVVVDDNYSVRITEIMKARDNLAGFK